MRPYNITLRFVLGTARGQLYVSRNNGDKAVASGYTRSEHGWGKEIHLLHLIRKKLEAAGIHLARTRISDDHERFGHLFGDNFMCYLRTPIKDMSAKSDQPHIWIVHENYAIQSSADDYNNGEEVRFEVQGDIFTNKGQDSNQPDWWKKLYTLCLAGNIPCELTKECLAQVAYLRHQ